MNKFSTVPFILAYEFLEYNNMRSYKLGDIVHADARIGLEVREVTCEKLMSQLLVKQYLCSRYEEADCLLKEAFKQVSNKWAVWAILKEVIFSNKDTKGQFIVNFIYEKLQSDVLSDLIQKNDKAQPTPSNANRYRFEKFFYKNNYTQMEVCNAYDTELNLSIIAKVFGPSTKLEKANVIIKEALVQAIVAHENATKILDIWIQKWENGYKVGFALERLHKDVKRDIAERKEQQRPYTEEELLTFLYQITSALMHAKKLGIAHQDIKPENIFIKKVGIFKIGDFGSAWDAGISVKPQPIFSFEKWTQRFLTKKRDGTPLYLSPEMRQSILGKIEAVDSFACDVYSLGVTVLEMATLEVQETLNKTNTSDLEQAIAIAISSLEYSKVFQSVIREMLSIDWKQRCILEKIFIQAVDLLGIKNLQTSVTIDSALNALEEERIYHTLKSCESVESYQVQGTAQWDMYEMKKKENKYEEAVIWLKKSLKIKQSALPGNHPDIVSSFHNLGMLYVDMGKLAKAAEYHLRSLKIMQSVLHENHPGLVSSFNNIGGLYKTMGELGKAEEYYLKSLKIMQSILPDSSPDLASSFNNFGILYADMGELAKAEEYYLKSINSMKSVLTENHPDLARSFNNLGMLYFDMRELENAEEYYLKSLKIRQSALPENHLDFASSFNNLGSLYQTMREFEIAEEYYLKSLKIMQSVLPENHPELASSFNNFGILYADMGYFRKAEEYYSKCLKIRQSVLPENHPDFALSFNNSAYFMYIWEI